MKVKDVFDRIGFAVGTVSDLNGKSSRALFTNKNIAMQLKFALDKYAKYTKAIEKIHSIPLDVNTNIISQPENAIRSLPYRFIVTFVNGVTYPVAIPTLNQVNGEFPYRTITGITYWALPWADKFYLYPLSTNSPNTTTLSSAITATDTTIPVDSTDGFLEKDGRITIGTEKIHYDYTDSTNFYGCERGAEDTAVASHLTSSTVTENNLHVFYFSKHFEITVKDDDAISTETLAREMDIPDEHIEVICDYTAYKLLSKVDPTRAGFYKTNFDEWLEQAKADIVKGRDSITKTGDIREPYYFENDQENMLL